MPDIKKNMNTTSRHVWNITKVAENLTQRSSMRKKKTYFECLPDKDNRFKFRKVYSSDIRVLEYVTEEEEKNIAFFSTSHNS